ncbi:response regulator transcription factor [Gottfriedia acidiceleris]|uniref:Response regulator transcription factor n=1 Tax=Gottfriedia acidiceleris TaxID=371036 RepID=A0ABY4JU17_9BACI|nr:response regulator transcription factor [Gottfriedia acidiceleris]UPM56117.1 response regulator transcription factor [Gottfriedia acidiceleris]
MISILLVDDEPRMLDLLSLYLTPHNYRCIKASSGNEAIKILLDMDIDLVILDVMMPEMDGWQTCKQIREFSNLPIIMVTARDQKNDVVKGLQMGADDYISKPFHEEELIERIKAILRRVIPIDKIAFNGLTWDEHTHLVTFEQQSLVLTPIEFSLLGLFLKNANQVFSREHLIEKVWGFSAVTEGRTVDSHIRNLRDKLRLAHFPVDDHLKSVYGVGYKWLSII